MKSPRKLQKEKMELQGHFLHDSAFPEQQLGGIPSEVDLQNLIRDTEEKLNLNACSIDQNLKDLQAAFGDSASSESLISPLEFLQGLSQRNYCTQKRVATGHRELLEFLLGMQNLLKMEEGHEESVLELLLNISSQCGVAFPTICLASLQEHSPITALSMPCDELALEVQEAWADVRFSLRSHLLGKLQLISDQCQSEGESLSSADRVPQKLHFLHQLLFLYPETKVLSWYQQLQIKAVLGVLQNYERCSTGGEKGFDRLTLGFRSALPTLCSMLREDIKVLNGITEPHNILTFLNHAYLNTVAKELNVLMVKEIETAQKDNCTHSSKGGKTSSKKSAVAPQDLLQRERNFYLTSHQLRCLTQLTSTFLEMEQIVEDLATNCGFLNCAGESVRNVKGVLKKVSDDVEVMAAEDKAAPDLVLPSTEVVCLEFGWRATFRDLVPQMAHCVKVVLDDVCNKSLEQEEAAYASGFTSTITAHLTHTHGSEKDSPKMVAKFCADVVEQLDVFLPLAVAFGQDVLQAVCSSFVEVCGRVSCSLLARLEERAWAVPASAPLQNLPVLLASSSYIHQTLSHYEELLSEATRMPLTLLPIQRSQEVVATLHDHLTSYSLHVCASSVLQDAESHYWSDPRPFYEGERCSFSVHMWHYFLAGLRSDLWSTVGPVQCRQVLARVLCETLELFVQRYSRACPSYKRVNQIRADLTALLLCVERLMWCVCESVEELLRPDEALGSWMWSIHSLCNQLLGTLIILTSPLAELNRIFEGCSRSQDELKGQGTKWLTIMNPELFTPELLRDFSSSEGSSLCLFEILVSGPDYNPTLLLQNILHKDCLLLQILISYSGLSVDKTDEPPDPLSAGDEFLEAVFAILSSINSHPRALFQALESYLDRRHLWEHFYSLADSSKEELVLFKCIRAIVFESTASLQIQLVKMMQSYKELPGVLLPQQLPENLLSKIPKEWNYIPQDPKINEFSKSNMNLVMQGLSFVFTQLQSIVASLPLPLRFLFNMAEKKLSQHAKQLRPSGLLLWVLLLCLNQNLENGEILECLSKQTLQRGAKECLSLLAECLQVSLGQQRGVPKPLVHKILQRLEEKRPKWTSMQMLKARKLCCESVFERAEDRGVPAELTEQKIRQLLLELCHRAGGSQHLRRIHHSIQLNEDILRTVLMPGKTNALSECPLGPVVFFSESSIPNKHTPFNPIAEFNSIGHRHFDQAAVMEREWDWAQLLPAYRNMSHVTFITLLANRFQPKKTPLLKKMHL
ncbi:hypothetical protein DNTS_026134 [Danionella cerebrum]|uniref:Uncharacterized protein n=1 Tax=Danionella cerebrum TaxID=2873325 RepID=A0A553NAP3_9TELE|nr:hypothetical protein DNTS_026134 [Danionella translucida]